MTEFIALQYNVFVVFLYVGAGLGFLYDIIRCFRRLIKHNIFFVSIEDICFWMMSAIVVLHEIQIYNNGELRIYILLSGILGFIVYHYTISCVFVWTISYILLLVKKTVKKLKKMLKKQVKEGRIILSVRRNR